MILGNLLEEKLVDWTPEMNESFNFDGDEGVELPKPSLEQLFSEPMEESVFLHHLKGHLFEYLSAIGWGTEAEEAQVIRELEQRYPTFAEQSDKLYGILEREMIDMAVGESTRIIEEVKGTGEFVFSTQETEFRIARQKMLLDIRGRREELHKLMMDKNGFTGDTK